MTVGLQGITEKKALPHERPGKEWGVGGCGGGLQPRSSMEASSASLEPLLNMKVTVAVDDAPPFGAGAQWAHSLNAGLHSGPKPTCAQ